ncbi:MAG: glycosyltransferase [Nanoarchaeota archaeon]|nr:glycosyltransferase [Nanoarchaeota archaeon]MBU1269892.1 glycosyltransferase [Nanoarchaeota archaeon]MBU1603942.1 glycosyltransferase [Nanoarchaeota archaeon]MBU2442559.1 glycosyltransferase [Nanoarchaeota archaeon]
MKQIRVSVVVLTRNRPQYLRTCLESIKKQDYPEQSFEVIVVDNNSSEENAVLNKEIVSRNGFARYICESKIGVSFARNTGVKLARYEYVAFIADDYELSVDYLASVNSLFQKNKHINVLCFNIVSDDKKSIQKVNQYYYETKRLLAIKEEQSITKKIFSAKQISFDDKPHKVPHYPVSGAAVIKKTVFDKAGLFDETFFLCEDVDFGIRLNKKGICAYYSSAVKIKQKNEANLFLSLKRQFVYGKFYVVLKNRWSDYSRIVPRSTFGYIFFLLLSPFISLWRCSLSRNLMKFLFYFLFILLFDITFFLGAIFQSCRGKL